MNDPVRSERSFGEKEFTQILALAVRIQSREGATEAMGAGETPRLSLSELQQVAAEVGIEPRHVVEALRVLDTRASERAPGVGLPCTWDQERTVGGQVSPAVWQEMVEEIRRTFGHPGTTGALGSALEWHSEFGFVVVTVTPQGEQTRLRITLRTQDWLWVSYLAAVLVAIGSSIAVTDALGAPIWIDAAITSGIFGGSLGITRQLLRAWFQRKTRAIQQLLARLVDLAIQPASAASTTASRAADLSSVEETRAATALHVRGNT